MAKSKVNASSTLALLNGMSTERQTKEREKKYASLVKADNERKAKEAAAPEADEDVPAPKAASSSGSKASGDGLIEEEARHAERISRERADYRSSNADTLKDTDVVKPGKTLFSTMVKEKKNVRKNFLLTSSNSEALRLEAENLGTSMNDLLNMILDDRYR